MNFIIPGRLASEPCGSDKPLGHITDDAIVVLNEDHKWYEDAKSNFYKVYNMGAPQLCKLKLSHPSKKDLHGQNLKLAAEIEWRRRKAANLLGNTL